MISGRRAGMRPALLHLERELLIGLLPSLSLGGPAHSGRVKSFDGMVVSDWC